MLEGVPRTINAMILREGLLASSVAIKFPAIEVRVAKSKEGSSRAFVQFKDVDDATTFVKEHFPHLVVFMKHSTDDIPDGKFQVFLHFSRNPGAEGETSQDHPGSTGSVWLCATCGKRNPPRRTKCQKCNAAPVPRGPLGHTGPAQIARDVDAKVQILCVWPLPSHVDEDQLAVEMKRLELVKEEKPQEETHKLKSTAPSVDGAGYGARPGSLHRVFLVREVVTNIKMTFGLAEFWTMNDACAALRKHQMTRSFQIAGTPVSAGLIHVGVFVPEDRPITPTIDFMSFVPTFNPSLRVRYRDLDLYASPKLVTSEAPQPEEETAKTATERTDGAKTKKRKADESLSESTAKKPPVTAAPVMAAQMALWQRRHEEIAQGPAAGHLPPGASVKFSLPKPSPGPAVRPQRLKKEPAAPASAPTAAVPAEETPIDVSYVDRNLMICLLCTKRYKSVEELDVHQRSQYHRRQMGNKDKVAAALPRVAARDQAQRSEPAQYRDRAKERRETHNQPDKPDPKPQPGQSQETARDDGKKAAESKGAGMLAKMGWSTGSGLGAQGGGLTEALTASAYKGGVGLGAEGGKLGDAAEIAEGRTTDSYASYLTTAQQKARERYNQME